MSSSSSMRFHYFMHRPSCFQLTRGAQINSNAIRFLELNSWGKELSTLNFLQKVVTAGLAQDKSSFFPLMWLELGT